MIKYICGNFRKHEFIQKRIIDINKDKKICVVSDKEIRYPYYEEKIYCYYDNTEQIIDFINNNNDFDIIILDKFNYILDKSIDEIEELFKYCRSELFINKISNVAYRIPCVII